MLWLRHSLQLASSHKLSLFLSHSLALCKSITNVAIKAMKCLDVPHTNGKFCVKLLWMRQMVTDNEWFKKKKKHSPGVVFSPQVHLFKIYTMKYDIAVDTLHHLKHRFSPPPWHIRPLPTLFTLTSLPSNDPQHPPEQSYTPLISSIFHFSSG